MREFEGGDAEFERMVAEVVGFVEAPGQRLDLPLDIRGTAFQQRVWAALQRNPRRQDGDLHGDRPRIGQPKRCARSRRPAAPTRSRSRSPAIGSCARRRLSGYRWGVERKRELIEREAA